MGKRSSFQGDYTAKVVYQIQTWHPSYATPIAPVTVCLDDQEKIHSSPEKGLSYPVSKEEVSLAGDISSSN